MQSRQTESDHNGDGRTLNVAYFATQGDGSGDEERITALLTPLHASRLEFDRNRKARSGITVFKRLARERPDMVVMEGTGIAGGAAGTGEPGTTATVAVCWTAGTAGTTGTAGAG